jgi:hypothetical protein
LTDGGWTKWWWTRVDQIGQWSADERRAVALIALTWCVASVICSYPALYFLVRVVHLRFGTSLLISFAFALVTNIPAHRGLATTLFPRTIRSGDDAAALRLGGRVYLPTSEFWIRGFWWIDTTTARGDWSNEQMKVRLRILFISFLIFVPVFLAEAALMMAWGASELVAALVGTAVNLPLACYTGRRIAVRLWPELVQKADDDAVRSANRSIPPRL